MSNGIIILRKHKNNLLAIIQESGLNPNLFVAENKSVANFQYFTLTLRDSPIFFAVRAYQDSFEKFVLLHTLFRIDFPETSATLVIDWKSLTSRFKSWLDDVVKAYLDDINAPDLWQTLEETRSRTREEIGTPEDFEPFSDEERIRVRLSLNDFQLLIVKNFSPNKEEMNSVDTRLKYLSDALDKHNKFDWKGIAINTVMSIIVALSLSPEQGHQLFELFKQVFSNVIYLLP